jgi:hypothetical protein
MRILRLASQCVVFLAYSSATLAQTPSPGLKWCAAGPGIYANTHTSCPSNQYCGQLASGQAYCKGSPGNGGSPGQPPGYKTCTGTQGRTIGCQITQTCAVGGTGAPYCTGAGPSHVCRGTGSANNMTKSCQSDQVCENAPGGQPYCGGGQSSSTGERPGRVQAAAPPAAVPDVPEPPKYAPFEYWSLVANSIGQTQTPAVSEGEPDGTIHTSRSATQAIRFTDGPCKGWGCAQAKDIFVVMPAKSEIIGIRYYSSAQAPSALQSSGSVKYPFGLFSASFKGAKPHVPDVPGWWNETGDENYPYRAGNNRWPLRQIAPDHEEFFFKLLFATPPWSYDGYGGSGALDGRIPIRSVGNRFGNRSDHTWRYGAIEVDWKYHTIGK